MKKYDLFLLDADQTLFDFIKAEETSLQNAFTAWNLPFGEGVRRAYREINEGLWKALERGEISKEELQRTRFSKLFAALSIEKDGVAFNDLYLDFLAESPFLLPGALEVCRELSRKAALYITTNGITRVQKRRLALSPLSPFISGIFVSEEAGAAKPDPRYFGYVFEKLGFPEKEKVLIVGDSLTSDIRGGQAAGIDSCWFNPGGKENPPCGPTYTISSLSELLSFV